MTADAMNSTYGCTNEIDESPFRAFLGWRGPETGAEPLQSMASSTSSLLNERIGSFERIGRPPLLSPSSQDTIRRENPIPATSGTPHGIDGATWAGVTADTDAPRRRRLRRPPPRSSTGATPRWSPGALRTPRSPFPPGARAPPRAAPSPYADRVAPTSRPLAPRHIGPLSAARV